MTGLRIALVTRRFWPLTGDSESIVSNLAVEMQRQGAQATIVTGQWAPDWSTAVVHRETPVVRIAQAKMSPWGAFWHMTALSRWLRAHCRQFDVVCVSQLRYDAYAVIGALRRGGLPVVLRAEAGGPAGDCAWQRQTRFGRRIQRRCATADAVVAASASIQAELLAAGYPGERIAVIANGVAPRCADQRPSRAAARRALAEINHDLSAAEEAPVAVCVQPFHEHSELFALVDAWDRIAGDWPHAQLWLIGDGPLRTALYEKLVDRGLHHQVRMPGTFDDLEDVLAAADVLVAPACRGAPSIALLEALAAGLPAVAVDTPDHRLLLGDGAYGLLAPPGDARSLAAALVDLFRDRPLRERFAAAGPQRVAGGWSQAEMAHAHLQLFARLALRHKALSA